VQSQGKAYLYAAIVVLIWSTVASAFKITLRYLEPIHMLFYATAVSVLTLFLIVLIQNKAALLRGCSQQDFVRSALLGFLNPFLYYVVLFRAYSLLPAQQAVSLNYTWAIQLVILSIPLLNQKVGVKSLLAIIVGYLGVLIIATRGDISSLRIANVQGTLLALGSAVIWALFWIYNIKDKRDEVVKLFLNFIFGFAFVCIYLVVSGRFALPRFSGMVGAIYIGLFEMGITFVLWLKALRLSKTTAQVSNLIYLTPFLSLLIINIVVGERILPSTIIGLLFILTGIALQRYPLQRNPPNRGQKIDTAPL
jgi:drug/metabolite transporter (DMT)-like permease